MSAHREGRALTVLVLGVGGNVSQGLLKALAAGSIPVRVLAGCLGPRSMGLHLAERSWVSPRADAAAFVPWLLDICREEAVDAVLSGSEPVLDVLAAHTAELRDAAGSVCLVSSPETLAVGADKLETSRWLGEHGLRAALSADGGDAVAVAALVRECGFPVVVKPRRGKGAVGVSIAGDDDQLRRRLDGGTDLVVQEHLSGEEFSVGCVCDADGVVRGSFAMRREVRHGTTFVAEAAPFPEATEYAARVARALRPTGPLNVQLRVVDGEPVAFELNVRFSGTTPMRVRLGFDEVGACLRHFVLGEPLRLDPGQPGTVLRYWNELYLPEGEAPYVEDWGARG